MKFLVDHMLGKLAKYLLFMGFDTYYPSGSDSDNTLLRIAEKEGRIIITRDRELARRSNGFLVHSDNYRKQLKEIVKHFNLNTNHMLTRCSVCNVLLIKVDREKIRDRVPLYVYEHSDVFFQCPKCERIYWFGTHTEKIKRDIEEIIGDVNED